MEQLFRGGFGLFGCPEEGKEFSPELSGAKLGMFLDLLLPRRVFGPKGQESIAQGSPLGNAF
jgi:hypothetical protein